MFLRKDYRISILIYINVYFCLESRVRCDWMMKMKIGTNISIKISIGNIVTGLALKRCYFAAITKLRQAGSSKFKTLRLQMAFAAKYKEFVICPKYFSLCKWRLWCWIELSALTQLVTSLEFFSDGICSIWVKWCLTYQRTLHFDVNWKTLTDL